MPDPLLFFWLLLKGSLFSFSGLGNLPSVHADLTTRGWADERQFAEALAVGQISPGPSGLWVISLGYLVGGMQGALLATLAIALPPWGVLVIERLYRRAGSHPAMQGFVRGLGLAVSSIFVVVMLELLLSQQPDATTIGIVAAAILLGMVRQLPVIVLLALAALAGILLS